MSKWNELNKRAFKLGLSICESHWRKNHYFLLDFKSLADSGRIRKTQDATIDLLEDVLAFFERDYKFAAEQFFTVDKMIDENDIDNEPKQQGAD